MDSLYSLLAYGTGSAVSSQGTQPAESEKEKNSAERFAELMKEWEAMQETPAQKAQRRAEERKVEQARKERQKKIDALYARIAKLRSQLACDPDNKGLMAQLSAVQSELLLLLMMF